MPKVICGKFSIERGKRNVSAKRELKKDKDQEIGRRRARGEREKRRKIREEANGEKWMMRENGKSDGREGRVKTLARARCRGIATGNRDVSR